MTENGQPEEQVSPSKSGSKKKPSPGKWVWAILALFVVVGGTTLVVPVGQVVTCGRCRAPRDKSTLIELEIAIKGYQTEYNRYPLADQFSNLVQPRSARGELLQCLLGQNAASNPRAIVFYDPPLATGGKGGLFMDGKSIPTMRDSHGNPVMVIIDYEATGDLANPAAGYRDQEKTLSKGILIYTAGKDHDLSTWEDNVTSWR